jgi:hypothetical protein
MKRWFTPKNIYRVSIIVAVFGLLALLAVDVFGRVGGGHSYSGGSRGGGGGSHGGGSGGSGDGGALLWLVFEAIRFLVYLTVNYPLIGIPVDIVVIGGIIYISRRSRRAAAEFSTIRSAITQFDAAYSPEPAARGFDQLKKFDPNFSEIVFTDFCYALYGKAHDARGGGSKKLELFSPYLSESARTSLLQRNPPGLQEVKGIIVGSMKVALIQGLETPTVRVSLVFESNFTEVTKSDGTTTPGNVVLRRRALGS